MKQTLDVELIGIQRSVHDFLMVIRGHSNDILLSLQDELERAGMRDAAIIVGKRIRRFPWEVAVEYNEMDKGHD